MTKQIITPIKMKLTSAKDAIKQAIGAGMALSLIRRSINFKTLSSGKLSAKRGDGKKTQTIVPTVLDLTATTMGVKAVIHALAIFRRIGMTSLKNGS